MSPFEMNMETAASGFETIEKVSGGAVYDIIFMDHMMPKMDGIETTKRLREAGYTKPIVALTANAIAGNDKMFKENGFDDFISKPIDIDQIQSVLNKFVRDAHKYL
ncbi:MAG: response regulator, partial [Treponema sp.]|jgi:CheY-like chemotaxis protein|nr:response regulator [Treponema sp.]